jgi:serine/threonine-protein phosphatase 6 regulatory ankyrin repeat subunit B
LFFRSARIPILPDLLQNPAMRFCLKLGLLLCLGLAGCMLVPDDRALWNAARDGDVATMEKLIARGANVNVYLDGHTPLTVATFKGHAEAVETLLKHKADTSLTTMDLHTPLQLAAFDGQVEIARLLVEDRADVNERKSASPPLLLAILGNKPQMVQFLIDSGVDLRVTWNGKTPLQAAAEKKYLDVADLLVKAMAAQGIH